MRRLGNIVSQLTAARRAMQAANANDDGRLTPLEGFGPNAGELDALVYSPMDRPAGLVVVLHGCTQTAAGYDKGSGWSTLADRHGFALLFPQQRRSNNANLCFNWFEPGDARRGLGEASSISQMVQHLTGRYRLDPSHVFITGLSAGGAMTSVMLATYPELFAGGAVIAGLPFASANTLPEALERMRGHGSPSKGVLAARVKSAADHRRHSPSLSVWHGTSDNIVDPSNATSLVDQWRGLHGLGSEPAIVETVDGQRRKAWLDADGRVLIERFDVRGMGHGTPLDTRGAERCGTAGPHMLDAGICSTRHIAQSWGLITAGTVEREIPLNREPATLGRPDPLSSPRSSGPQAVIEDALRAAGLMR
jgi:poly(hydroxyalkanoate) depolymerase family esterase